MNQKFKVWLATWHFLNQPFTLGEFSLIGEALLILSEIEKEVSVRGTLTTVMFTH